MKAQRRLANVAITRASGNAETVGINCNPRCPKQGLDVGGNMCQFFGPTKIGVFPKDPTYTRRSIGIKPVSVGNETVKTTFDTPPTISSAKTMEDKAVSKTAGPIPEPMNEGGCQGSPDRSGGWCFSGGWWCCRSSQFWGKRRL